jgi:2',3'-cyclic-nucleotide 2'-phosphodiesterase (5'-nucleotidase family)
VILRKFILLFAGAGLWACSSHLVVNGNSNKEAVSQNIIADSSLVSIIKPYKDSLDKRMNEVIAYSEEDFNVKRPASNLMNWVANALFVNQTKTVRLSQPVVCLLNTGGIRSSIGKGNVTLGDLYKVMPFDNTVVWVELPIEVLPEIEAYLNKSGGEPMANLTLIEGKLSITSSPENPTHFWVITSDYLLNGGDKMTFFTKRTNVNETGKLLRNVLIEEARSQGTLITGN